MMTLTSRKLTKESSFSVTISFPCLSICSLVIFFEYGQHHQEILRFPHDAHFCFRAAELDVHRGDSVGSPYNKQVQHRTPQLLPVPLHPEPHPLLVQECSGYAQICCKGEDPPQTGGKDEESRDGHLTNRKLCHILWILYTLPSQYQ